MNATFSSNPIQLHRKQSGVTLLIAIVFLLIITVLGITSMRGVSLESRITANLKQQKTLMSAAEAGLRMGETCLVNCALLLKPAADANADTPTLFTAANNSNVTTVTSGYDTNIKIQWYTVLLGPLGPTMGNNVATGAGLQYFEVNACASTVPCTSDTTTRRVMLRSVIARPN
jgi:type IV pilus assembly protein PilX